LISRTWRTCACERCASGHRTKRVRKQCRSSYLRHSNSSAGSCHPTRRERTAADGVVIGFQPCKLLVSSRASRSPLIRPHCMSGPGIAARPFGEGRDVGMLGGLDIGALSLVLSVGDTAGLFSRRPASLTESEGF